MALKNINSAKNSGLARSWKFISASLSSCFRMLPEIHKYSYIWHVKKQITKQDLFGLQILLLVASHFLCEVLSEVPWLGCYTSEGFLLGNGEGRPVALFRFPKILEKDQEEGRSRCWDIRRVCSGGASCIERLTSVPEFRGESWILCH